MAFGSESAYDLHVTINYVFVLGFFLQFSVYLIFAWNRYKTHLKLVINYYNEPESYELRWLRWLLFSFVIMYLWNDIFHLLEIEYTVSHDWTFPIMSLLLNFGIGYLGITHPVLFYEYSKKSEDPERIVADTLTLEGKHENISENALTEEWRDPIEKLRALYIEACKTMTDKELFKNPELTLSDMAQSLGVNTKYLSQAINNIGQQSFSSWVNEFRINNFVSLLSNQDSDKYSIKGLMQMAGFRNKTTFLNAFKKKFGITPSQYLKRLRKEV